MSTSRAATRRILAGAAVFLVLLAGVVVVLIAPGKTGPPAASPAPSSQPSHPPLAHPTTRAATEAARPAPRIREVNELLRRRADAVRRGDREAFLAGIDPAAPAEFRQAQARLFDNLRGVPLADWHYEIDPRVATDTRSLASRGDSPEQLWAPKTRLVYALAGVDDRPTNRPMGYLFAERSGHWYLSSDTALGADKTWRGPWDFGPCQAMRTRSGLVLYHPESKASADAVAAHLDAAVAAVTSVWGNDWSREVAVFVPSGKPELRSLVGPEFAANTIAAISIADSVDPAKHLATGQRVVLNPDGASRLSAQALAIVLRHEITHVAARKDTVDGAPMWVLEGFADYVGYTSSQVPVARAAPDLAAMVRAGKLPRQLPKDADFQADAKQLDLAYQEGWTLCAAIAERYGQPKLVRFFQSVVRQGKLDDAGLDRVLRAELGTDTKGLLRDWRGYLRDRLR